MSSTNKTTNYQLSQFVGTDIPSILNDYNGDMRKIDSAIHDATVAGGDNASAIAELQSTVGRHTTEITGINANVTTVSGKVVGIEALIPDDATEENKLITAQDIPEIPSISGLEQSVAELTESLDDVSADVKGIQLCVPANASDENQFAVKSDIKAPVIFSGRLDDIESSTSIQNQLLTFLNSVKADLMNGDKILKAVMIDAGQTATELSTKITFVEPNAFALDLSWHSLVSTGSNGGFDYHTYRIYYNGSTWTYSDPWASIKTSGVTVQSTSSHVLDVRLIAE